MSAAIELPEVLLDPHPTLEVGLLTIGLPTTLGATPSPGWLRALLDPAATVPFERDDDVRGAVRGLLRHGGYKPAGRGKPASEFLARAAGADGLRSINAAVDVCNVVSLHSGLPISVVDLERARPPFRIGTADDNASYRFNPAGQEIRLAGLLCLHDAAGPCANAVKDSQRTKTHDGTRRTLSVIWGSCALPGRTADALRWYAELAGRLEATVESGLRQASG